MKAVLCGSIGVLAETSDWQRQAYNQAFAEAGLPLHWNIATYCDVLTIVGGKNRLNTILANYGDDKMVADIHARKEQIFADMLRTHPLIPRDGIVELLQSCIAQGIRIGFVTTTTRKQLDSILHALSDHISADDFSVVTSKDDCQAEKPAADIYHHALTSLGLDASDVVAIEDTEMNQQAATDAGIFCHLMAGDYARITKGENRIFSATDVIMKKAA